MDKESGARLSLIKGLITEIDFEDRPLRRWCKFLYNFGGRDGIRTHDLLIANEDKSKLRRGATIT